MSTSPSIQQLNKVYQDDALAAAVYGASPVGLVVLLYEGAIHAIGQARRAMEQKNFAEKAAMISKATDIIEGLRVTLNHEQGEEIASNLEALYQYAKYRLSVANMDNSPAILAEVTQVLSTLLSAWRVLDKSNPSATSLPNNELSSVS